MKLVRIAPVVATLLLALLVVSPATLAKDKPEDQALYPNTTREAPETDLHDQDILDALNKGLNAVNAKDAETANTALHEVIKEADSQYAKAMALQGLANLSYNQGDIDAAIKLMQRALDNGVMPNDTYFQLMYGLVQFYVADKRFPEALDKLHQWRKEGRRETADSYAMEGNINYRLGKYTEAIAAIEHAKKLNAAAGNTTVPDNWSQILSASYAESGNADAAVELANKRLAADPTDTTTLHNAVTVLIRAGRYQEAADMMQKAHDKGVLKTGKDYMDLAKLYMILGQNSDTPRQYTAKAREVLQQGLAGGQLEGNFEVYKLAGDAAWIGGEVDKALASYEKAKPWATDGSLQVRMGEIIGNQGEYAKAINMIESGIAKGVDNKGRAYLVLGAINGNAGNKAAAIAAMENAAKYPETRDKANDWLKEVGRR